jgi:exopolysaccharide biosynthesis predicted pyruvyltransferase EpsI
VKTSLPATYSRQLHDTFLPLIPRDRPVALVDFPDSANAGDHAIWLGEKRLLKQLGIEPAYQCSAKSYDRAEMARLLGDGTILMHGGGNFGDRYPLYHEFRWKVLADFPRNRTILFPQTASFLSGSYLRRTVAAFAKHPDVTLFARDVLTQHTLSRYFGGHAQVKLATDMAFMLGPLRRLRQPAYDIVWIARTDKESVAPKEARSVVGVSKAARLLLPSFSDGAEMNLRGFHRKNEVLLTDWYSLFSKSAAAKAARKARPLDEQSQIYVRRAVFMLSLGKLVITDRLHAHILCLLLKIPHVFLNNDYGKNWNFYETWTRASPLARLARNPADAWAMAHRVLAALEQKKSAATLET